MKFTFASFAALSLTATQAAKLSKGFAAPKDDSLIQKPPMSYSNIMESVKSLEKAYEYHKNEEKLLNEINSELHEYWNQADKSHKFVEDGSTASIKEKAKAPEKKSAPSPTTA